MRLRLILRLISALIFASFAALFALLIPPIPGMEQDIVRIFLTLISALVGFLLFPDIAENIRVILMRLINLGIQKVSAEVSNQIIRLRPAFSFPHPSPTVGSVSIVRPAVLDTSAIIDGRVLDIAKTGFVSGLILVPKFVLTELQQVADSADDLKRQRGRRGFEVVEELKKIKGVKLEVWDKDQSGKTVDEKIMNLAKNLHGKIITTDFNLNKVASVASIGVLNVNDLSNALKTNALPGETLNIKIVHVGKDQNQGVGYLPDGTMIVVADGVDQIGKTIKVEVSKSLQISAGRMVFARKV